MAISINTHKYKFNTLIAYYNIYLKINSYTWTEPKLCLVIRKVHSLDLFTYTDKNVI